MNAKVFFTVLISLIVILLAVLFTDPATQKAVATTLGFNSNFTRVEPQSVDPGKIEIAKVRRVVDGDTIQLEDGRSVRYLNIDTPETVHPTKPKMCYGQEAKEANIGWVEGKEVQLVTDKNPTDKYGRDLRLVFLPGRDTGKIEESVNAALVKGGFARASIYKDNPTFEKDFLKYEREAREANIGAWKSCPKPFEE